VRGREMTSLQLRQLASLRLSPLLSLGLSVEWWGFGTSPHRNSDKNSLTRYIDQYLTIRDLIGVCVGGDPEKSNSLIGPPFIIKLLKYNVMYVAWV
jgi:hypothetical protein